MPKITVCEVKSLSDIDLSDLCEAAEQTITDDYAFSIGLNKARNTTRSHFEAFFRGALLVPERRLLIGRYDGVICGSMQIVCPSKNDETSFFAVNFVEHFVAPWARGFGTAKFLLEKAEEISLEEGFSLAKISVRSTQRTAINLYESMGYRRWGVLERYEMVDQETIPGYFYCKDLC